MKGTLTHLRVLDHHGARDAGPAPVELDDGVGIVALLVGRAAHVPHGGAALLNHGVRRRDLHRDVLLQLAVSQRVESVLNEVNYRLVNPGKQLIMPQLLLHWKPCFNHLINLEHVGDVGHDVHVIAEEADVVDAVITDGVAAAAANTDPRPRSRLKNGGEPSGVKRLCVLFSTYKYRQPISIRQLAPSSELKNCRVAQAVRE